MSSMMYTPTTNPQLQTGLGGTTMINPPTSDDPNLQVGSLPAFGVPTGYGLPINFAFPQSNPLGGFTDDQYLAADAALRANIAQQYTSILQQLGYTDPNTGNVIPGTVPQDANIQLASYLNDLYNEQVQNVQNMQNAGTLFSGIRPQLLAQAQLPTQQNIAALNLNTSRSLNSLYNQAQQLVTSYNTQNQTNLADAAARNLAAIQKQQLLSPGAATDTSGGVPTTPEIPSTTSTEGIVGSYGQGPSYAPATPPAPGKYTAGGGATYYQSGRGAYGSKPLY